MLYCYVLYNIYYIHIVVYTVYIVAFLHPQKNKLQYVIVVLNIISRQSF